MSCICEIALSKHQHMLRKPIFVPEMAAFVEAIDRDSVFF